MELYKATKTRVDAHNKKYEAGESSYSQGINQFSDQTDEEFKKHNHGLVLPEGLGGN